MKKIIFLIILGWLNLYGYSVNPIDPPAKSGDNAITITPTSHVATNKCVNPKSVVDVTVVVTITDCPNYKCSVPGPSCTLQLCIYEGNCFNLLGCPAFIPDSCTCYINVRANENSTLYSKLVVTGCTNEWNAACLYCAVVPQGGGTVYCSRSFCP